MPYRLLTLLQIGGVLVLAAGIPAVFKHFDFTMLVIGYVIMRSALVAQWLRAAAENPDGRSATLRYTHPDPADKHADHGAGGRDDGGRAHGDDQDHVSPPVKGSTAPMSIGGSTETSRIDGVSTFQSGPGLANSRYAHQKGIARIAAQDEELTGVCRDNVPADCGISGRWFGSRNGRPGRSWALPRLPLVPGRCLGSRMG